MLTKAVLVFHDGMGRLWKHLSCESNFLFSVVLDLSTFDPEGDTFWYVRDNLSDLPLEAAGGSGARMIVKTVRPMFVPGMCSLAVGILQTRFSATKQW